VDTIVLDAGKSSFGLRQWLRGGVWTGGWELGDELGFLFKLSVDQSFDFAGTEEAA